MTLPADLLFVFLAGVGVVGFRRRRGWAFAVAAVVAALLLVRDLLELPDVRIQVGLLDLALAGLIVALAADLQGLPPSIARRIGWGYRSREWEFDDRLHLYKEALDRVLLSYPKPVAWPEYESWKSTAIPKALVTLGKMRAMRAPDPGWKSVRDDYVLLYEGIFAGIADDQPPDDKHTIRVGQAIKERADQLRVEYRASARRMMGGSEPKP